MSYVLPPPHLIAATFALGKAGDERRRKLMACDAELKRRDWLNTDPGRGPVRGYGR